MRFFEYEPELIDWLLNFAVNRPILDVGCGEGHLLRDLLAKTWKAHGIDFRAMADPDVAPHVIVADAATHQIAQLDGWLLVIARPCHGAFIHKVLDGAHSDVLIFTRPSTIEEDAGEHFSRLELVDVPGLLPATNGEQIVCYLFKCAQHCDPWTEVEVILDNTRVNTMWVQRIGHKNPRWQNWKGAAGSLDDLAVRSDGFGATAGAQLRTAGAHWRTVPLPPPDRLQDDGVAFHGWIGPSGLLFSCRYFEHDDVAYDILGLTVEELGLMDWRKTVATYDGDDLFLSSPRAGAYSVPTEAQLVVLDELNRRIRTQ